MQRHTVRVGDLDLSWLEAGSGPPVLFLHGWPTHAGLWRHVLPVVGRTRRAIALDLPGFGQSSKPVDASYSFRFYDKVLDAFLAELGIERTGLVVHDLGGPLGLHWAATRQDRITDLALLDTLVFPQLSWAAVAFVAATFVPGLGHALTTDQGLDFAMRFGVSDKARITPEVAASYRAPFQSASDRRALRRTVQRLHPSGMKTIAESLHRYEVPVRLIYGEDDRILPDVARTMQRVRDLIPQAELTSLPGCGHFLQEDRPEEVAGLLAEFLGRPVEAAA